MKMMKYYVLHVATGKEDLFNALFQKQKEFFTGNLFIPKRELIVYKQKKKAKAVQLLFPGYVFWYGDENFEHDQQNFRRLGQYHRVLGDDSGPIPLSNHDQEMLKHFMNFGPVLGISRLVFNEHDRVVIKDGPLLGLEGLITKVDKRKGRARIKLDLYNTPYEIDFGFEVLTTISGEVET